MGVDIKQNHKQLPLPPPEKNHPMVDSQGFHDVLRKRRAQERAPSRLLLLPSPPAPTFFSMVGITSQHAQGPNYISLSQKSTFAEMHRPAYWRPWGDGGQRDV